MRPLSTKIIKSDASYDEIIRSVDTQEYLKQMKSLVMESKVVFFIYKGCDDSAIVMMNNAGFYIGVCHCPKILRLRSDPDLLYALCYGS